MMRNTIISAILAIVMMFAPVCAGAQVDFLFENVNNYTEETSFTMTFDNSKEIVELLKELEMPKEYEAFADIEKFLETLLSVEGKMYVQADVSEDMKKAQVSIVSDEFNSIDFNRNLKIDISSKLGMWVTYDFTDTSNPVFEIIYSLPFMEKYVHIDIFEMLTDEEKEEMVSVMMDSIALGSSEETKAFTMELFEKYADMKVSLSGATIKIDNDGIIGIIKEMTEYVTSLTTQYMSEEEKLLVTEQLEAFDFENLQILGKDGILLTYNFKNGNISTASASADISIDISGLYTSITGMEWDFISDGKIDFSFKTQATVSKIGSTKVEIPALNEKNFISLSEMIKEEMGESPIEPDEENYNPYPYWYIGVDTEDLPIINGEIYVPLRKTLESGYEDSINIGFENGVITVAGEYFPNFKTIQLSNGSNKIYLDGVEKETATVVIIDGTTYVSHRLFTEYFGWEFVSAYHEMLTNTYSYAFYTQ